MTMLIEKDPILEKFQKNLESLGIKSELNFEKKLDFEFDFLDAGILGTNKGIGSAGAFRIKESPIDFIQILKKQKMEKCDYALGSHVGMGFHLHSWWKLRFFLTFPEPIEVGPLNIGTLTTIRRGRFRSKVEDFIWNGHRKLTTLPPGLVRDNVADMLYDDQNLRHMMMDCLLKERTIIISKYSPPKKSRERNGMVTDSKIMIQSQWKLHKDLFLDQKTIDMYERIALIVKKAVYDLKYHLSR